MKLSSQGKKGSEQMKTLLVKLGVIVIGLIIFAYAEMWGVDWKFLTIGADGTFQWYDTESITQYPNRVFRVWIKVIKAEDIIETLKNSKEFQINEIEQMTSKRDHERSLMEVDCIKKTFSLFATVKYDKSGKVKDFLKDSIYKVNIPPESVIEILYKQICK
jgi:hypothetical protein